MKTFSDRSLEQFYGAEARVVRWEHKKNLTFYRRIYPMSVHKDCFAYRVGRCTILTEMICKRDSCSFYKTKEQMEKDRIRYGHNKNYQPKGAERETLHP
ncbi:MAG: hypothetical protein E7402_04640 [Ruminococcaceae bacterium]|nr:hypothetical protein [Oscillospiraceae bacterium]